MRNRHVLLKSSFELIANRDSVQADIVQSTHATGATHTGDHRHKGYPVTGVKITYPCAAVHNNARDLVSNHTGEMYAPALGAQVNPLVSSTNPACLDLQNQFARARHRPIRILDSQVFGLV